MGSNYPDGFESGITIRGIPVLNTHAGSIFWVDSEAGSDAYNGTRNFPFATIDYAISRCTANNGDIILVKPGHAETLTAAAAILIDVAGIAIIGLGSGADRPKLTFSTSTDASVSITAAGVTIERIIGISGIDGLTKPFDVSGDDCYLDIEWRDASATVEAARAVLATTVSRLFVKIFYRGFITGDACVNVVRLIEVTDARIIVDVYGEISTGIVEMVTTASTNVLISGYFYNDNVALTKNVVNTGGLVCTWFAYGYDGKGGYTFSGGSASALASDDVSTTIATLGALNDAAASGAVTDTDTLVAYIKQLVTEGIARDADIAAVQATGRQRLGKNILAAGLTGTTTRFTVSGGPICVVSMGLLVTTALPAGANTLQFSFTPTGGSATALSGATDIASAAVQQFFMLDGAKATGPVKTTDPGILAGGQLLTSASQGVVLSEGIITTVFSAGPPATGAATIFIEYEPLVVGATVA